MGVIRTGAAREFPELKYEDHFLQVHISPFPGGAIITSWDITETRNALAERKKLEFKLQQAQKMEAIANLAGGVAHQFNNALAVMAAHLDLLDLEFPENSFMFGHTGPMKDAVWKMTHLTSQLLAYARGGKYQAKILSLYDFVKETLPLVKHTVRPEIRIVADLPPETWPIEADVTQMQMVLSAVLANASDAIEKEGVIRITAKNVHLTERDLADYPGLASGPYIVLTVQDNGKGMDEETRQRIFEPFFTTKFQGRGLGMAAVYGIVKNHRGWTQVDSQPNTGTSVHLILPAATEWPRTGKGQEPAFAAGTGTILIVEDEQLVLEATRRMLERLGYQVLEAKSGSEALDMATRHQEEIDLVLLDIQLPDMHGKEIYPRLNQIHPGIKVIVCSGYSIDGPAQEILNAGAEAFLQKPFSLAALSKIMKEILGGVGEDETAGRARA